MSAVNVFSLITTSLINLFMMHSFYRSFNFHKIKVMFYDLDFFVIELLFLSLKSETTTKQKYVWQCKNPRFDLYRCRAATPSSGSARTAAALQSGCGQRVLESGSCPSVALAGFTSAPLPCRPLAAAGAAFWVGGGSVPWEEAVRAAGGRALLPGHLGLHRGQFGEFLVNFLFYPNCRMTVIKYAMHQLKMTSGSCQCSHWAHVILDIRYSMTSWNPLYYESGRKQSRALEKFQRWAGFWFPVPLPFHLLSHAPAPGSSLQLDLLHQNEKRAPVICLCLCGKSGSGARGWDLYPAINMV